MSGESDSDAGRSSSHHADFVSPSQAVSGSQKAAKPAPKSSRKKSSGKLWAQQLKQEWVIPGGEQKFMVSKLHFDLERKKGQARIRKPALVQLRYDDLMANPPMTPQHGLLFWTDEGMIVMHNIRRLRMIIAKRTRGRT